MIPYALFALPGPGDVIFDRMSALGMPPELLVHSDSKDFATLDAKKLLLQGDNVIPAMQASGIEMILVAGWEKRIPSECYEGLKYGGWNIHPSLLPKYRGHNPYFAVLAGGERETGVTVHQLTGELDRGPILLQKRTAIDPDETIGSLWNKLSRLGAEAAAEALALIERGRYELIEQPAGIFPDAPKIKPEDLMLHSHFTVAKSLRLIRACNPFYGAVTFIGGKAAKVFEAKIHSGNISSPTIPCADGILDITVLDLEGYGIISGSAASEYLSISSAQNDTLKKE